MAESGILRKAIDSPMWIQILVALALAFALGLLMSEDTQLLGVYPIAIFGFFGDIFISALKMIVVPLVMATIIVGVVRMASQQSFGRVAGTTVGIYLVTGALAITVGLLFVNLIQPGDIPQAEALVDSVEADPDPAFQARLEGASERGAGDLFDILKRAVPENIIGAAAEAKLLGIIFFAVVFGFFLSRLEGKMREVLENFWEAVHDVMVNITLWIMKFAPIGVFCLVCKVVMQSSTDIFVGLAWFMLTVLLSLGLHIFATLPVLAWFFGNANPIKYYRKVLRAQLTAFSTASSAATLPITIDACRDAGISDRSTSFVLPLGATVNMDGTALYECVVVIFVAQLYAAVNGIDFSIVDQLIVVILALATSIGVAGIPSASIVAIVLILGAVGLPAEWIGIVFAVDRILDMCRTAVNVTSDTVVCLLISRREGEHLPGISRGEPPAQAEATEQATEVSSS